MAVPHSLAISLWRQATQAEFGIRFQVSDRRGIQAILYKARKAEGDPSLDAIMMVMPKGDEIWLVKKTVELES